MVVDAFMFFNELDTLEIRLRELSPVVDLFVLLECGEFYSALRSLTSSRRTGTDLPHSSTELIMSSCRACLRSEKIRRLVDFGLKIFSAIFLWLVLLAVEWPEMI